MIERIPLTGSRGPYGDHDSNPSDDYIMEVIEKNLNGRKYISHTVHLEETRDGTIIHNGIEMQASRRDYYLELQLEEGNNDPKEKRKMPKLSGGNFSDD